MEPDKKPTIFRATAPGVRLYLLVHPECPGAYLKSWSWRKPVTSQWVTREEILGNPARMLMDPTQYGMGVLV
jgi:hypothetical protein